MEKISRFFGGNKTETTIDAKNRLCIPAALRKQLGHEAMESFVIEPGPKRSIILFPKDVFVSVIEPDRLRLPEDEETFQMLNEVAALSSFSELDSQGRIMLTLIQLQYAEIEKEIVVVGRGDRIQVWDKANYYRSLGDPVKSFSSEKYFNFQKRIEEYKEKDRT
ncbi:MAG: hypothetical protein ACLFQK_02045 [Fibrobacterota bacterium]